MTDFDREIDRHGTNSLKWDFAVEHGKPADVLPLWVADMDFRVPDCVIDALHKTAEHGIFGYSDTKTDYFDAVSGWFFGNFGWKTEPDWLIKTPGVVHALATSVRAFTNDGDAIIINTPVYYPFYSVIAENGRKIVRNELILQNGHYELDFEDFEAKIRDNNVKMFILCSPHNPTGRVWTRGELERLGEICDKYNVIVVSDEIHCDFAFSENPHTVFIETYPALRDRAVICTAPSKTFNLAGLKASNIWIPSEKLRSSFKRELSKNGYSSPNTFAFAATEAAYLGGGEWLSDLRGYLRGNLNFLREFLAENIPQIKLIEPEGTYFAWLDCRELGLTDAELDDLVENRAKLWLDAGKLFGDGGSGFERVVLACTRKTLTEALNRLKSAVDALNKEEL